MKLEQIKQASISDLVDPKFLREFIEGGSKDLRIANAVFARCQELGEYDRFNHFYGLALSAYSFSEADLEHAANGKTLASIDNYLLVFRNDKFFANIKYNEMTHNGEVHSDTECYRWSDTDDAKAMWYIEKEYRFLKEQNYVKAMRIFFDERKYHPVKDIIEAIEWDGKSRICDFLHTWTKCEDTPYTREASRLIFSGGINRLYLPGCKFDDMVVLIGTNQGEGKSTLVRWLAMNDKFFTEVNDFDGQRGTEATEGAWICEVSELLAMTKTKEQEAVKSYLTRQVEKYRMPYDKHVSERPRQCIFIGTTNKSQFLTDRTGNRRFYPVKVAQVGYDLFDHEDECRDYIAQCWAEARELFKQGKLPAYANRQIVEEIRKMQQLAEEDDYRIGMIANWLESRSSVCLAQLWCEALNNDLTRMTKKDSSELTVLMAKMPGWERVEKGTKRFGAYGTQKYWKKDSSFTSEETEDELPF